MCSASLIKRGLVVTAAHCVAAFGQSRFYTAFSFVPGYRNGNAPFLAWSAQQVRVMTSYFNGTDSCAVSGMVSERCRGHPGDPQNQPGLPGDGNRMVWVRLEWLRLHLG